MISKVGASNYSDDNNKKINDFTKQLNNEETDKNIPIVEEKEEDKGIPIDSFEWQYKKIIIKKGLDKNNDDFIQENEYNDILDYFEVSDINKLLKKDEKTSSEEYLTEISESENDKSISSEEFSTLMDPVHAVLRDDDTAAYELQNNISFDLLTSSIGTPFEAQMKNLYQQRKNLTKNNDDTDSVDAKIVALNEAVKEYIKIHQQDMTKEQVENGLIKKFNYGKENNKKTGYYVQTFGLKANNTFNHSEEEDVKDNNKEVDVGEDVTQENDKESITKEDNAAASDRKSTVGGITYNIEVVTDKIHAIGHIDADNENSDISAVAVYNNPLKNGGKLNFSGNFRQTIEPHNNQTSFGASFDYSKQKFSTGTYVSYESEETEGIKNRMFFGEAYAKRGKTIRGAVGFTSDTCQGLTDNEVYVKAKTYGTKKLKNNLTLIGSLEGKYGIVNSEMHDHTKEKSHELNINAIGGLSFKSNHSDFSANVLANVNYDRIKMASDHDSVITSTLLGNVSTKKLDVVTTLTATNFSDYDVDQTTQNITESRVTNWSSSITVGLKKILGKNVTPSFTYNLNSDNDNVSHNVAANLGINF